MRGNFSVPRVGHGSLFRLEPHPTRRIYTQIRPDRPDPTRQTFQHFDPRPDATRIYSDL